MQSAFKPLLLSFTICLFSLALPAQIFDKTKGKNVQKLYNQPVHVYTYGKGAYHERLAAAFNTYWKVTAFELHDYSKGLQPMPSGSSVFMPAVVGLTVRDHATSMNHPFYVFGESTASGSVYGNGIVTAFPINGFHYELDVTADSLFNRSLLRVPYIVQTMNEMLTHLKTNGSDDGYFKMVDARSSRISKKTMLIPAELLKEWDVNPNTTALMKANLDAGKKSMKPIMAAVMEESAISYSGKYKIMSTADIIKLEQSAEAENYTLFLPAINDKKYMMVFDLKTRELLYYETTSMGMKIKSKDFDKLNKAMGL